MNTLVYRDLGDLTAERDDKLPLYFIEDIPAYGHSLDLESKKYILMGRTGAGKSAIIKQVIKKCATENGYSYSAIDHNKRDLDYIVSESKRELQGITDNIESIIYKLSWHYTIVINMLRNKYKESPLQAFKIHSDTDRLVYEFLKQVDSPSIFQMTISDLFVSFLKLIKIKASASFDKYSLEAEVDGERQSSQSIRGYSHILRQTELFVHRDLRKVVGGDKIYILIDDLDLEWDPSSETQQKLISALFSAINIYLSEPNIKPIVALRTDIFKGLRVHQREKYSDLILKVEWDEYLLKNFISRRIETIYPEIGKDKVSKGFFCDENDEDLIRLMIQYTLERPRDLLELCKIAIQKAVDAKASCISKDHIEKALNDYSINRVIALEDEWKLLYPNIENLIKLLAGNSGHDQIQNGYSTQDFLQILNAIRDYLSQDNLSKAEAEPLWFLEIYGPEDQTPQDIVTVLYDVGIIYLINEGKLSKQASSSTMPKITTSTTIRVHPMFARYMEVMIYEEENPWLIN